MFQVTDSLPPAGIRALRALSAREHSYASAHRRTSLVERARALGHRFARLSRAAALADARAADLAAEAR